MNKSVYSSDIQRLQQGLDKIGLSLSAYSSATYNCPISFYLYRNPDGSIRWLWPVWSDQPDFLRFYHAGSRKAQLFAWLVRLLFRLKCGRFVAHDTIALHTTEDGFAVLRRAQVKSWALFTGTVGPNRKLVIWYRTTTHKSHFLKIALTPDAEDNLRREAVALRRTQQNPFRQINVPGLTVHASGVLIQQDLGAPDSRPVAGLADLPYGTLQELAGRNWHTKPLQQTAFWQQARQTLVQVRAANDTRIPVSLLDKLERLMYSLDSRASVAVAAAHGDFTPWNMLLQNNKLCLIDWEMAQPELPGLYDLFHFHYQANTLIGNNGYRAVRQAIDAMMAQPDWRLFCENHPIDTDRAELLYLVHTVTYYLSVYSRQPEWHQQINWLLTTWNDALTYWLSDRRMMSDRQLLLHELAFWLHNHPYAALKFLPAQLTDLLDASDLDLCLPKAIALQLTNHLRQHPLASQVVVEHRSFMKQLHIVCRDNTMLHIDLIWTFKRKQLEFMPANAVWEHATLASHGLYVPTVDSDKAYVQQFYGLNNAPVPERYQTRFGLENQLTSTVDLLNETRRLPQNRGWRGVRNTLNYVGDSLRSFAFRPGMIVTFSGVDGAGKSTVIEQTKYEIEKKLRQRVVVLRHRPSVLPILSAWKYGREEAEQRSIATLPRQGTNQHGLSSLLRFGYYFIDYLLGQFYVQVKYVWRGYIVLYDRYYFDFINDSRRSNLQLPAGLATSLYWLLLKPRLNIFLYAPADDILRRKQELDAATITTLTHQYLGLFSHLQHKYPSSDYMPILNQDLPLTMSRIFGRIQLLSGH